jgi:hypothetical protein
VWLIPTALPGYDDQRVPLTWLTTETQRTADLTIAGFPVMEFRNWAVPSLEFSDRVNVAFPGAGIVRDWQVEMLTPDMLRVIVYWEPTAQPGAPLHGFLHLIGPSQPQTGSPLWTQDDHPVTIDHWTVGQIRRDVYTLTLPHDAPSGDWSLAFGLYHPATLERLPTADGADHVTIPLPPGALPAGG